jgi:uncharacterized MAPEG superfamily protein
MVHAVVFWSAAWLVIRLYVVVVFQVRTHLYTNQFSQPEDAKSSGFQILAAVFKPLTLAFKPLPQLFTAERLNAYVRNVLEHEVVVLILMALWPSPSALVIQLYTYFVYSRFIHMFFFLTGIQPFRTIVYLVGFIILPVLAYLALQ